ncbi:MAG: kynureninase, partial [Alphaproteobacteria bacterium]
MITREDLADKDAADTLAPFRNEFALPEGVVYLDGNSLGALPKAVAAQLQSVVAKEWGSDLIRS